VGEHQSLIADTSWLMTSPRHALIRSLFEEYVELYESRNDLLTTRLSENFCGYTGGGNFLVDDRQVWIDITRQDFTQLPARARIEVLDLKLQDLHDDIVVVTALTHIRLPMQVGEISREFVRLTLIFRREGEDWKAVYVAVSIPDQLVQDGEVYPKPFASRLTAVMGCLFFGDPKECQPEFVKVPAAQ
jgi:hypothetical protein